jgi:hypothetical protein
VDTAVRGGMLHRFSKTVVCAAASIPCGHLRADAHDLSPGLRFVFKKRLSGIQEGKNVLQPVLKWPFRPANRTPVGGGAVHSRGGGGEGLLGSSPYPL